MITAPAPSVHAPDGSDGAASDECTTTTSFDDHGLNDGATPEPCDAVDGTGDEHDGEDGDGQNGREREGHASTVLTRPG